MEEQDGDSSSEESEEESEQSEVDESLACSGAKEGFAGLPLFRSCGRELMDAVLEAAPRMRLEPNKALELQDGGPLVLIESGAVQVCLGSAAPVVLGPGAVFNTVGMLRLAQEAEPFRPKDRLRTAGRATGYSGPYELFGPHFSQGKAPPLLFTDRRRKGAPTTEKGKASSNDALCFYNLCPTASAQVSSATLAHHHRPPGWLGLRIVGAPVGVVPTSGGDARWFKKGGANLAVVSLLLLEKVGSALGHKTPTAVALRASLAIFKENCNLLANTWRTVMSRCSGIFPGVPPEILWGITEIAERHDIGAGELFVNEGDSGDLGDALILIDEGDALVEKTLGDIGRTRSTAIGRLGPGALIGDLCLVGAGIPRAASVRAKTAVSVIVMPVKGLLAMLRRFPGIMESVEAHAREIGNFLQLRLPMRDIVISAQEVFAGCKHDFCNEVGGLGEWHVFISGEAILSPHKIEAGTLFVLEYGTCALEIEDCGQVEELPPCCCFGDCKRVGLTVPVSATVRALTPVVLVLTVTEATLDEATLRHYSKERPPFERRKKESRVWAPRSMEWLISSMDMFCNCERAFISDLCKLVEFRGYMPGQTLCVEGSKDPKQQMFVIRGGQTVTEQGGQRLEVPSKNTYGDMTMLGAVHRRSVTVRAQTFCFTMEIPRITFHEAIVRHPEQRQQFEQYAVQAIKARGEDKSVQWPMLGSAPPRFVYLLNLYARQRFYAPDDPSLATLARQNCAVLVLQGQVTIMNDESDEVDILGVGGCFNEQIFLGIAGNARERVVLKSTCELQVVGKDMWDRVIEEFPKEKDVICKRLMTYMAEKAALKYGVKLSSPDVLRKSSLMKEVSDGFAEEMCKHLESHIVVEGRTITVEGQDGNCMYLLLRGKAYADSSCFGRLEFGVGYIFGEAMLLGLRKSYPTTVRASSLCILQAMNKSFFQEAIRESRYERELLATVLEESRCRGACRIDQQLQTTHCFMRAIPEFVMTACEHAEDKFYPAGALILPHGEPCFYGKSPLYVILAGEVRVEDELGVFLYNLECGTVFGEAGALGLEPYRSISVLASSSGYVHCVRLKGEALMAALNMYPEERETFDHLNDQRTDTRMEFSAKRKQWLEGMVLPALSQSALFLGCPPEFLEDLAAPLTQTSFEKGEEISTAGDTASSMLVLLHGFAIIETQSGTRIGQIRTGASVGEIAVLGLFDTRLATVRAACPCHVLEVPAKALQRALGQESAEPVRAAFGALVASRHEQVEKGLPLCALDVGACKDDTCVRSIGLQAEAVRLIPGELWNPLPDSDPNGPHFSVLAKGRAVLEIAVPQLEIQVVPVMNLERGALLLEGVAAEYVMHLRAVTPCEVYRVRQLDFLTSVTPELSGKRGWQDRFEMLEARTRKLLKNRGDSARGIIAGLMAHPNDPEIHKWGLRRQKALSTMRSPRQLELYATLGSTLSATALGGLPGLSRDGFSKSHMLRQASAPELHGKHGRRSSGDSSQKTTKLPSTLHLPQLRVSSPVC